MKQYLASREVKEFLKRIEQSYGKAPKSFEKLAFVKSKERIYLVTRDIEKIEQAKINIDSRGLYIAELKNEQVRLSIEGTQLIGPTATKNVCEITTEQLKEWLKGNNINASGAYDGFVILKHFKDYVGSGKYKEGTITNYVPKARRLKEIVT